MIPILYRHDDSGWPSTTIARLKDCLSCTISEEVNGKYECKLEYPASGYMVDYVKIGNYLELYYPQTWAAKKDTPYQFFRVYKISRHIHGKMTIYGEHISYMLDNVLLKIDPTNSHVVDTYTPAGMITETDGAMAGGVITVAANDAILKKYTTYDYWINSDGKLSLPSGSYRTKPAFLHNRPYTYRSLLYGQEGSIVDKWGGFFVFSNYKLYYVRSVQIAARDGITLRYGHNVSDAQYDIDTTSIIGSVIGYVYKQEADTIEYSDLITFSEASKIPNRHTVYIDVSEIYNSLNGTTTEGTTTTTTYSVNDCTRQYINQKKQSGDYTFLPESLTVSTERVHGDPDDVKIMMPVSVELTDYNITMDTAVKSLEYDVLNEKVKTYEIGKKQRKIADFIS